MQYLNDLAKQIHADNKRRGFDTSKENIGQSLMLVVSELSEALEADRTENWADLEAFEECLKAGDILASDREYYLTKSFEDEIKDTFEDEIADAIIRLLDLAGALGVNIGRHIELKLQYNSTREYKHGKRY